MRKEYDFSTGKRGAIIPSTGKTRITIYLDDDILDSFRARAKAAGVGYQTLINEALKIHLSDKIEPSLTVDGLRQILREELSAAAKVHSTAKL
ncbi:MAG: BrnA antitoxin family protein, partial [Leptolyngbyaceae bacterium]|nr:BrnA antitoxin family protein [Leptolyngbyaceae bacterium]